MAFNSALLWLADGTESIMLAETDALPLGFVAIVALDDLQGGGAEQLSCRATCVVGEPWTIAVDVPRATLRPVSSERAAGVVDRLTETRHAATARAGYPG